MANNFQLLPNPTFIPEAVSTGYQRQNTNLFAAQTGLDNAIFSTNNNSVVKAGSVLEYNGALYKILTDIDLTNDINDVLNYYDYCFLSFDGEQIEATHNNGDLNPSKFSRYLGTKRILNIAFKNSFYNWPAVYFSAPSTVLSCAHGNNMLVSTAGGPVYSSPDDGITWSSQSLFTSNSTVHVLFEKNLFVVAGGRTTSNMIFTSTDGITWTQKFSSSTTGIMTFLKFVNNMFFTFGANGGFSSQDGNTWTSIARIGRDIAYGNGTYIAGSNNGLEIIISTDLTNWTQVFTLTSSYLTKVIYGNDKFMLLCYNGNVFTSSDLTTWTNTASFGQTVIDANYLYPFFVVHTNLRINTNISYYTTHFSKDGVHWFSTQNNNGYISFFKEGNKLMEVTPNAGVDAIECFLDIGKYNQNTNKYFFLESNYKVEDT
jgi:hypothetical protein